MGELIYRKAALKIIDRVVGDFDFWAVTDGIIVIKTDAFDKLHKELETLPAANAVALPCKVGDTLWSNIRPTGLYFKVKDAPYPCRVVFIGINNSEEFGGGFVNVVYKNGKREMMLQFNFKQFGEHIFTRRSDAIMARQ